ncbi:MAG: hypothetical protein AB7F59_03850 [Bdellovibrionales bacterium]
MPAPTTFEKLKAFLESKPASQKSVKHLKKNVEVGVVIGNQIECAYFHRDGQPVLEERPAQKPDVIFYLKPETVEILCQHPGEDVGEFGIAVLKEYMAGGVRIKVPGSVLSITMNGYLGIVKEGGATFMKFLAMHGVSSLSKIASIVKNLKST